MKKFLLYAAYLCTCLEDRSWSFAISLCMHHLGGIRLVSIEQLVEGLAQISFSGAVGKVIDLLNDRKWGMMMCLMGNNYSMICSSLLFVLCLSLDRSHWIYTISLLTALILCAVFRVFVVAERNLLARDWAVVLVEEKGEMNRRIAKTNTILTALDQLANVLSPICIGALFSLTDMKTACIILAVYSGVSFILKGIMLTTLHENNERLSRQVVKENELLEPSPEAVELSTTIASRFSTAFSGLTTYYRQSVFPAALGLALLYMTVLGFNGLDIAYGESVGLPESVLGFSRSFGSMAGFSGALTYAVFVQWFGVRKTGVIGMKLHVGVLLLCVVSVWLPGSPWNPSAYFATLTWSSWWQSFIGTFTASANSTKRPVIPVHFSIEWSTMTTTNGTSVISIFTFLIAIAASRFGLWMTDLAITHLMQISTPESQRNAVFGVQNAVCKAFSVLKDVLVIALPSPNIFGICIILSYIFKCAGMLSYVYYIATTADTAEEMVAEDAKEEPIATRTESNQKILPVVEECEE